MNKQRSIGLVLFFCMLAAITLYFLTDRMITGKERFFNSRYTDQALVELVEGLIADGVIKAADNEIVIDEELIAERHLKHRTEERVRNSLSFMHIKNGEVYFDKQAVSIGNNRTFAGERVARGRFLDRRGVILAESIVNDKMWKQARHYTDGPEFYPIIGYWNPVYGRRNLEKEMDDYLNGKLHAPISRKTDDPLKDILLGDDITLTLDRNLQRRSYELMKEKKGAVVVLDVKTGEILAAVSAPSFDPNTKERNAWRDASADNVEKPHENRAFSTLYPPGSTFKTVVASAWIEKDAKAQKDGYKTICTGGKNRLGISDIHVHGHVNLDRAYAESCNVFFSELGVMLGQDLLDYAERFGFNKDINLIPQIKRYSYRAERSSAFIWSGPNGNVNDVRAFSAIEFRRNPRLVAQGAIGQNIVMATPLQMATIAATIANKGILMNPYVVKEIKTGDGKKSIFSATSVQIVKAVTGKTALEMTKLMEEVMQRGTGKDVKKIHFENRKFTTSPISKNIGLVRVAGKTGTAEVGDRNGNGEIDDDEKPHSWFIGFAPADNPRFAVAVIAENQGFGSLTAAPIAMDVLAEALNQVH